MIASQVKDATKVWLALIMGYNSMSDSVEALEHVSLFE